MARESVEAYAQFLDDAFSRYQSGTERATESAQQGTRTLADTTAGLVCTATGAAGAAAAPVAAGATRSAAESVTFPIEGYDEMNVDEVSERLDNLSAEELRQVRDYEERNKGRETLLEQMDRKIRAS